MTTSFVAVGTAPVDQFVAVLHNVSVAPTQYVCARSIPAAAMIIKRRHVALLWNVLPIIVEELALTLRGYRTYTYSGQ